MKKLLLLSILTVSAGLSAADMPISGSRPPVTCVGLQSELAELLASYQVAIKQGHKSSARALIEEYNLILAQAASRNCLAVTSPVAGSRIAR